MVMLDNQLIGNQSYPNGSTAVMEKRTEQAKASAESSASEKQALRNNTNDIAAIYEKSDPSSLKMVTYAKPSTVKAILGFIGVFNFINVMSVGVMSRRHELATLESIGMSKKQLRSMLRFEGIGYAGVTLIGSITLGNVVGFGIFKIFQGIVTYAIFNYPVLPVLAVYVIVILICLTAPTLAYHNISKNTLVDRLRQN